MWKIKKIAIILIKNWISSFTKTTKEEGSMDFPREAEGMDYTYNHYFRKSQTITHEGHVSKETLAHLAEQGIRLI